MIAPQILGLSVVFSLVWGVVLWGSVMDYREACAWGGRGKDPTVQRLRTKAIVRTLRNALMAFVLTTTAAAYILRTILVLVGESENTAGLVTFFALLGTNLVGGLYCAISLRFD